MADNIRINHNRLLLVEGEDAVFFFKTLRKKMYSDDAFQIVDFKGVTDLRTTLDTIKLVSNNFDMVTHLGIVRDYETTPNPFQSMQDALKSNALPVPKKLNTIIGDELKVIVTLLPDGDTSGMLESLCWRAFQNDSIVTCIDTYLGCLQEQDIKLLDSALPKAKMNILIASKSMDSSIRKKDRKVWKLRYAVQKSWWPWEHPAFDDVKAFIQQLATG